MYTNGNKMFKLNDTYTDWLVRFREEVDHMRKKVDWKDGQITDLIQENTELKEQIAAFAHIKTTQPNVPRVQESLPKQDSPDSLQEINNVYQQFDK